MEYRCLVVGDPIVEPGALLRRLLDLDFPPHEARTLQRQSLRDMRELESKLLAAPECVDDAPSLARSSSERWAQGRSAMCVSMPADDEWTIRLPNPSIPSVDITIRFQAVTEPRDLLRVLGVAPAPSDTATGMPPLNTGYVSSAFSSAQATSSAAGPSSLPHPGMLPHAVVAVFNPFARRSFPKLRVEWRHFLGAIHDAEATRQQASAAHNPHALSAGPTQASFIDSRDPPMSPLSPYGGRSLAAQHGPSGVYEALADPSMAPPVLLVGTRFEMMQQAIETTPSVLMPTPSEVADLAMALGAKAYLEVGTFWDDTLDELRLTIARACVGELSHSPVVRAPLPLAVRQISIARSVEDANNAALVDSGAESEAEAPDDRQGMQEGSHRSSVRSGDESREEDIDVDAEGSDKDAQVAVEQPSAGDGRADESQPALLNATHGPSTRATRRAHRSQWTWRQHPITHRVFYVHRATRHTQYERPTEYDGEEPAPLEVRPPDEERPTLMPIALSADESRTAVTAEAAGTIDGTAPTELPMSDPSLPCLAANTDKAVGDGGELDPDAPPGVLSGGTPVTADLPSRTLPGQTRDRVFPTTSTENRTDAAHAADTTLPNTTARSSVTSAVLTLEQDLLRQLRQKEADVANIEHEVQLLRDRQRVLGLQAEQNAKLRSLFDKTRTEVAAKQNSLRHDHDTAIVTLQEQIDELEAKLATLTEHVPAVSGSAADGEGDLTRGLGAAPSFLFTPEEWATVQHATAAEKEQLLLERAVESAGEQLRRVLRAVESEQTRARSTFAMREKLTTEQEDCQAEVDQLLALVAEQEMEEAALVDALREIRREQERERDALHTQKQLADILAHTSPIKAVVSAPNDLHESPDDDARTLRAQVVDRCQTLHDTLATAGVADGLIDQPTLLDGVPQLIRTVSAWLDSLPPAAAQQDTPRPETTRAAADARKLAEVGCRGFRLSCAWQRLTTQSQRLDKLSRRVLRALNRRVGQCRQDAAAPQAVPAPSLNTPDASEARESPRRAEGEPVQRNTTSTAESGPSEAKTQSAEWHQLYDTTLLPLIREADTLANKLAQAAAQVVSATARGVDATAAADLPHSQGTETFMQVFWWHLMSTLHADALGSAGGDAGHITPDWDAVMLSAADLDGADGAYCKALKAHREADSCADTSTET